MSECKHAYVGAAKCYHCGKIDDTNYPAQIAGLATEVERLNAILYKEREQYTTLMGECDRLAKERDEAVANDERTSELLAQQHASAVRLQAERDQARAEVERLQAALVECNDADKGYEGAAFANKARALRAEAVIQVVSRWQQGAASEQDLCRAFLEYRNQK